MVSPVYAGYPDENTALVTLSIGGDDMSSQSSKDNFDIYS